MPWLDFLTLFGLTCMLFPCKGIVYPPLSGSKMTFLPGSTEEIEWTFDDTVTAGTVRTWSFTRTGSSKPKVLALIIGNNSAIIQTTSGDPVIAVKKPATLVLKKIDHNFDGKYTFEVSARFKTDSEVVVFVAAKPNVTVNCSSPLIVKEGDDVICECKCEGGNPPAECTWYKNGTQIGEIGKDVNTLILRNFNGRDSGRYTCVGQSHVKARDEQSIRITDIFKPVNTAIKFSQKSVEIGKSVTITCASEGFPEPRFTIFHNDTKVVSNERTYTICQVKWDDAGTYKCFAKNELGNDAAFAIFAVEEMQERVATMLPTRSSANTNITPTSINLTTSRSEDVKSGTTEWYIIVITLVSGIIIGILLSNIVSYSRRKLFTQPERTPEVQKTTADSTYQELDLKKMNKEDNYQSLRRNDGVNSDESNYTELNKVRDIESNYQSLT